MSPTKGNLRKPARLHWVGWALAVTSAFATLIWPIFVAFVMAFTFQATWYWCFYRSVIDGRQVWDRFYKPTTTMEEPRDE